MTTKNWLSPDSILDSINYHGTNIPAPKITDQEEIMDECKHFKQILNNFRSYKANSSIQMAKLKNDFKSLPLDQQALLPNFLAKLENIEERIDRNQSFFNLVINDHLNHEQDLAEPISESSATRVDLHTVSIKDIRARNKMADQAELENIQSLLRQVARDWSSEGKVERSLCYDPIISMLRDHFSDPTGINILVPGAGLSRLAYEIANLGFNCQGNEFSLYMLLASELFLNKLDTVNSISIYPYITPNSNHSTIADQLRPISVPDCVPIVSNGEFSMIAGDFVQIYKDSECCWDGITSCFFLDTAKNIIEYLSIFHQILKPGGVWINLGPLLYHFEGSPKHISIELSLEEVIELAERMGFKLITCSTLSSTYSQDRLSMHQTVYTCSLTKMVKMVGTEPQA